MGSLFNSLSIDTVQIVFINSPGTSCVPLPLWNDSWDVGLTSRINKTSLQENHLPSGVFGNTSGKGGYQRESKASFIFT